MNNPQSGRTARVGAAAASTPAPSRAEKIDRAQLLLAVKGRRQRASLAAITLEVDCIEAWRRHALGATKAILTSRSVSYAQDQGAASRGLTLGDLTEAIEGSEDAGLLAADEVVETLRQAIAARRAALRGAVEPEAAIADFAAETHDVIEARLQGASDDKIVIELRDVSRAARVVEAAYASRKRKKEGSR